MRQAKRSGTGKLSPAREATTRAAASTSDGAPVMWALRPSGAISTRSEAPNASARWRQAVARLGRPSGTGTLSTLRPTWRANTSSSVAQDEPARAGTALSASPDSCASGRRRRHASGVPRTGSATEMRLRGMRRLVSSSGETPQAPKLTETPWPSSRSTVAPATSAPSGTASRPFKRSSGAPPASSLSRDVPSIAPVVTAEEAEAAAKQTFALASSSAARSPAAPVVASCFASCDEARSLRASATNLAASCPRALALRAERLAGDAPTSTRSCASCVWKAGATKTGLAQRRQSASAHADSAFTVASDTLPREARGV
mmetsp:Transcript_99553/g.187198  ORF Transcript_99553/g.187198 Transcript_99553/m.187198 type:complete len:316 (-) Transcript_99553:728-1675(-)